jgi:hypothetical protein
MRALHDRTQETSPGAVRARAMQQLLAQLEAVVSSYRELPDEHRRNRLADQAELITAEVARCLAAARTAIGGVPTPR